MCVCVCVCVCVFASEKLTYFVRQSKRNKWWARKKK